MRMYGRNQQNIVKQLSSNFFYPKKCRNDLDNHDGVITNVELDILECEFKWALESNTTNKANRSDESPDEPFKTLKHDTIKVLHLIH